MASARHGVAEKTFDVLLAVEMDVAFNPVDIDLLGPIERVVQCNFSICGTTSGLLGWMLKLSTAELRFADPGIWLVSTKSGEIS